MKKLFIWTLLFLATYQSFGQQGVQVVFNGNSITYGYGPGINYVPNIVHGVNDYPSQSERMFTCSGPYTFDNSLSGTSQKTEFLVNDSDRVKSKYNASLKANVLVPYEFINSIRAIIDNNNNSRIINKISEEKATDSLYLLFSNYCKARKDSGWKVIILTVMPFGANSGTSVDNLFADRVRVAINNLFRAHYQEYADGLVDIADNPNIVKPDKSHPNEAGLGIIASAVYTGIQNILKVYDPPSFSGHYYSKSTGNLHELATWGTNTDGSGENPLNFNGACKTFHLRNRTVFPVPGPGFPTQDYVLTGNWAVEGTVEFPKSNFPPASLNLGAFSLTVGSFATEPGDIRNGELIGTSISGLKIKGNKDVIINFSGYAVNSRAELGSLTIDCPDRTVTLQNPLNIYGVLDIKNGTLANEFFDPFGPETYGITLKSTASNTARFAPLTPAGVGLYTGHLLSKVTVERYIPARRAWRLLGAPIKPFKNVGGSTITQQSIKQAWQENIDGSFDNPVPESGSYYGYGTIITGGSAANGFDPANGANSSLLFYDNPTNTWKPFAQTNNTPVGSGAYMLFVRGDRTVPANLNVPPTNTILRSTGLLKTGDQTITVNKTGFTAIQNPFASPIDIAKIKLTNTLVNFYLWDPKLGGTFGVGGWVLVSFYAGIYIVTPNPVSPISQFIQSGQGFMVHAEDQSKDASIVIGENAKAVTPATNVFKSAPLPALRTTLQITEADNSTSVMDEAITMYGNEYSNEVDDKDAYKPANFNENLGLLRNGKDLMLESRKALSATDTLFLKLWNTEKRAYQLQFTPENLAELPYKHASLVDNYLNTTAPISLSEATTVKFKVDASTASANPQRFMVVLSKDKLNNALVTGVGSFKVSPNPINGRTIQLQIVNQPKGTYNIQLVNSLGQVIYKNQLQHAQGSEVVEMMLKNNIAKGVYQLHISNAKGSFKTAIPVICN